MEIMRKANFRDISQKRKDQRDALMILEEETAADGCTRHNRFDAFFFGKDGAIRTSVVSHMWMSNLILFFF